MWRGGRGRLQSEANQTSLPTSPGKFSHKDQKRSCSCLWLFPSMPLEWKPAPPARQFLAQAGGASSPRELRAPSPPPLCRTGLMGVKGGGEGGGVRGEEKRPLLSLLLYWLSSSTQHNRTAPSQRRSAGPRSPGDRPQQPGLFFTSQLSASVGGTGETGLLAVPGTPVCAE